VLLEHDKTKKRAKKQRSSRTSISGGRRSTQASNGGWDKNPTWDKTEGIRPDSKRVATTLPVVRKKERRGRGKVLVGNRDVLHQVGAGRITSVWERKVKSIKKQKKDSIQRGRKIQLAFEWGSENTSSTRDRKKETSSFRFGYSNSLLILKKH